MNIHVFQHVFFEDPAFISEWAQLKSHEISRTAWFKGETAPAVNSYDWLLVLGGPMNIYEEQKYPWLRQEKVAIREAIQKGRIVLGICLGAQLIADALGCRVTKNVYKEIGWHPVKLLPQADESVIFRNLPETFTAFHWHGDTFETPPGCLNVASSEACKHQAFEYSGRVVGLQFHLESTEASIQHLIQNCPDDLRVGKYVQDIKKISNRTGEIAAAHQLMARILNRMASL